MFPNLAKTETQDTGQVIAQTAKQLVPRSADNFYYFAEMCVRVDGHTYPTPTHLNYTLFNPVGVCALISPWNVPFMTSTWKVAPALAFGNTAVLKMSELSPLTAARLGELALEAGIPAGVLNVVHGYGAEAGEPLCRHPDVRAISFTGSTATGNRIVKSGGLEEILDGTGRQEPLRRLRRRGFRARAGCRAVHDLLQQRGALYRGLAHFGAAIDLRGFRRKSSPSARGASASAIRWTMRPSSGPMISPEHLAKVRSYIELGSKEGATLLCGGVDAPALRGRPRRRAISSSPRFSRTWTTACASPRKRFSARWPA